MTAALMLALWLQNPPPVQGVAVVEAGLGFRARTRTPNVERRNPEPRGPQFVARADAWMTFQAVLENNGAAVEGTLVLREAFAGGRGLAYQKRITLPARSRKRVAFPVLHSLANPFSLSLEDDGVALRQHRGHPEGQNLLVRSDAEDRACPRRVGVQVD